MVTIVDFKTYQNEDGQDFHVLVVQGGVEAVISQETQRAYLTARKAYVSSTFDEMTCKGLIGEKIPGSIKKVPTEPYEFTVEETGEIIELSHRYQFVTEEDVFTANTVKEEDIVHV